MNGNVFVYGTMTSPKERKRSEQEVNKIIKANLPQELSKYFLFDAMQSSELLKKNVFAQTIRDNFENVLGFKKYLQLKRGAERLQQEMAQQRLQAEQEVAEYNELVSQKEKLNTDLNACIAEQDSLYKYLTSMEEEYNRAKEGARQSEAITRRIEAIKAKVDDIVSRASIYADEIKGFMENIELNVFLPKMASHLSVEIENILRTKQEIQQSSASAYPLEVLHDVTSRIISYLKDLSLCSPDVDEENVVNHMVAVQNSVSAKDPFDYLDTTEISALKGLTGRSLNNQFVSLYRRKQELEISLATLEELRGERKNLEQSRSGGNEFIISAYEENKHKLEKAKVEEGQLRQQIRKLESRIHTYDVQIQQEPNLKYDTLVKLRPFFDKVADSLLKKKKAQIESDMKEQLNRLLVSYKGHIGRVELSDSMENFNIRIFHTKGNPISLNQLNAASKQIFIQVLLKVLRNLGDYNPPVMIDTVMGVLDNESREMLFEEYFPDLAEQTILFCTTSEVRPESDYKKLEAFISRTYTLHRNVEEQKTTVSNDYFGIELNP
ncbi:MAG: DNA sulfur modification protein DndD, partial [Muribaculaceae bacterium]|nr:DNA sulfur modification protein DndD [Muribaculaceae bacterium]